MMLAEVAVFNLLVGVGMFYRGVLGPRQPVGSLKRTGKRFRLLVRPVTAL